MVGLLAQKKADTRCSYEIALTNQRIRHKVPVIYALFLILLCFAYPFGNVMLCEDNEGKGRRRREKMWTRVVFPSGSGSVTQHFFFRKKNNL